MRRGDEAKERVIAAAVDLFARKGYQGTGMSELERAVQMGRGALYYHIGNKEALLFEISIGLLIDMNAFAEQIAQESMPPDKKLTALGRRLMNLISDRGAEVTVFYREWQWLTGDRRQEVLDARDQFELWWQAVILEGVERGDFVPVSRTALLVKGMLGVFNYAYLWFRNSGPMSAEEIADEFVDFILYGISTSSRPNPPTAPSASPSSR